MDVVKFVLFRKLKKAFTSLPKNSDIKENTANQIDTLELKCLNIYIQVKPPMEQEIEGDI